MRNAAAAVPAYLPTAARDHRKATRNCRSVRKTYAGLHLSAFV